MTDALLTALTEYFDRDFMPVFDRWGLTVSDDVKNKSIEKAPWKNRYGSIIRWHITR